MRVSFTDDEGNEETLTSGATEAVAAAEPTKPPAAPTNLTGLVNDDGTVTLSWDAPDDDSVTGYQILRRRPTMGETELLVYVADTGSTATTFTDTGVTAEHPPRVPGEGGQRRRPGQVVQLRPGRAVGREQHSRGQQKSPHT